ncbi:hypothetical protein SAMN05660748_3963 [Blastococcus aggregatus]|uniref:Uncharacterized protein n=1 Tax=Blastococcus aggregatus TaxID=38502 RepID=A0A285VDU1_9ACTN|nr:hypothetical protein [Blastococcus aggregatus]SOC52127.1 hypothetical protein SAMN05660748_3963 [Blastococcus aggregatus]
MTIVDGLDLVTPDDDDPLVGWTARSPASPVGAAIDMALTHAAIEDTDLELGLAAVHGDAPVATARLRFLRRLRVDDVVHLYSERDRALTADLTMDPRSMKLSVHLEFAPAGRSATQAAADAEVLHAAATGALALVMPDGQLAPERFPASGGLAVDASLLRLLRLLADMSVLSGRDIIVPEHLGEDLIKELLRGRRLLRGETVRGHWTTGQVRFAGEDVGRLRAAVAVGDRHQLRMETEPTVVVGGVVVPLGEVEQVFEDAIVESLEQDGDDVVLALRAPEGSATMSLIPIAAPTALDPRVVLTDAAFDDLLADLDQPVRPSRFRELL